MMARPWASATAVIPLRPAPPPTTAAVPAPMNTNAKVPMNSARSLGAIRSDIILSGDEINRWRSGSRQATICWLGGDRRHGKRRRPAKRTGLLRGDRLRPEIDAQRLRDASSVGRIRLGAVGDVPLLDVQLGVAHRPRRVLEQQLLLYWRHFSEQVAGLFPMVVVDAVVPVRRFALDRHRRLGKIGLVVPEPRAVGIVSERSAQIAVGAHLAVAVVALERAHRCVDGDVVEIDAEPVALGVAIGEQPPLE